MKIAIACDHGGFHLKEHIKKYLTEKGIEIVDHGTYSEDSVDYPDFANALAAHLENDKGAKGILVCGSGIGISIAANRHKHIRCALCHDENTAMLSRLHNDANVLAFSGRFSDEKMIIAMLGAFFDTQFEGGRHQRRIDKL